MKSFFAEPALKAAVRMRVAEHQRLDQIVQGAYWENGKGCFIGCSLHSDEHEAFERLLGLPTWLAYLGERLHEGSSKAYASTFPLRLYDAIPVGADLEPVRARFLAWLILDPEHGMVRLNPDSRVRAVGEAWESTLRGEQPDWPELLNAAWAASAAWAAADAAEDAQAGAASWDRLTTAFLDRVGEELERRKIETGELDA